MRQIWRGVGLGLVLLSFVGCSFESKFLNQRAIDQVLQNEQASLLHTINTTSNTVVFLQTPTGKTCRVFTGGSSDSGFSQSHEGIYYHSSGNQVVVLNIVRHSTVPAEDIFCIAIEDQQLQQQTQTITIHQSNGQTASISTNGAAYSITVLAGNQQSSTGEYLKVEFFDATGKLLHTETPTNR
ncbi:MAG TPA: hypothetical protein DEF47_14025 [Herpetosiphon sp.]|uniref:Lipoprotein n=1 Tax=Herpetosiphon aurantiacus (strain ATCC 23779 / DSM 785 / 114-95) TaxID=316274 RepID=A9AZR0_HERA2|nr:hypothetical protein [Herpetosiphon sp.]ABX07114.1 hypothetical protein Haur_4482 [Herpetosiphon aurantiacus DSM 785]HBW51007.1 hypothetical protein [Herpetosiphon sp.]